MKPLQSLPVFVCFLGLCIGPVQADPPKDPTPEHEAILAQRDRLAESFQADLAANRFDAAQVKLKKVYEIERSVFGDTHEELLGTLDFQAKVAEAAGDLDAVIKYRRAAQGMGQALYASGDYHLTDLSIALKNAIENQRRSPEQREQLVEARRQDGKMMAAYREGNFAEAIRFAKRIKAIRENVLGRKHPQYADSLHYLASLHRSMGDYVRAEPLFLEAKAIREQVLGHQHPDYATSLNNLALLYFSMGEYARAKPLYVEAKAIREQVLGRKHPDYAISLNNLALLYRSTGDYARAEPLYLEAKAIREKVFRREHPQYASSLNNLAVLYRLMGEYARAEPLYLEAKAIYKKVLGREHPRYATSLNNLALLYRSMGDYARSELLYLETKAIYEKVLGREHPSYATSLNNLALLYRSMGDYARAEPLYLETRAIYEKVLGREHPDYATSLNNLALLYVSMADYARAEPLYIEAKAVREKVLGREHPLYAGNLNNLAQLYESMGDYARAEPPYLEAKAIREKVLGREHPDYAESLNNLAGLYYLMGDYARAEPLYVEAKVINEKVLGREHPSYATSLNNLALLYESLGDYVRAEPLYGEAKAVREKVLGREHPDYASSLNNLAALYRSMGDYARAEPLYLEAKAIREKVLGREHPDYATSLNNLAALYRSMNDFGNAEPLYVEAKAIREKVLGRLHPSYATSLEYLASLYESMGDYPRAEPLYVEAKTIRKEVLGREHPSYATSLNNLGLLYDSMGKYAKAEPLYLEAKAVFEKLLGREHPNYAISLNNLAFLYKTMGDYGLAEPLAIETVKRTLDHVEETSVTLSRSRQVPLVRSVQHRLDNLLGLIIDGQLEPDAAIRLGVRWKGSMLLRSRARRLLADDPAVADSFKQLRSVSARYAQRIGKPPESSEARVAWRDDLQGMSEQIETLEKQIAAKSEVAAAAFDPPTFEKIRQSIPRDAVLVDLVDYARGKKGRSLAASIIARDGPLKLIDLGSSKTIAELVDRWRKTFGERDDAKQAGIELRKLVWHPIEQAIGDAPLVLVSPDGPIGRMPLAALPGKRPGTYLIEERSIVRIPVPGLLPQLMRQTNAEEDDDNGMVYDLLLMGDVDYDAGSADEAPPKKRKKRRSTSGRAIVGEGTRWNRLDEAAIEIDAIDRLYEKLYGRDGASVVLLRGGEATEAGFEKLAPKSRQVHLATHGFFADPARLSIRADSPDRREMGLLSIDGSSVMTMRGYRPGLLSGLVMAGANVPPTSIEDEDGILTAEEIAYLPMGGVELAVLSACETGLGATAGGEGITGIQRAFQVAGVDTTVASLWKVDDEATRKLMQRFYENYEDKELSAIESLRQAQRWMLDEAQTDRGKIRKLRPADAQPTAQRTPPRYWAAFTLSGDWR
ncbi:MAG: tetratricopeptide repeat protein [Planctomycetota bacterium]